MLNDWCRILPILLIGAALSGCLGSGDAPGGVSPVDAEPSRSPAGAPSAAWKVGDDWRYQVAGSRLPSSYTVRAAVVHVDASGYALAVDDPRESALAIAGLGGVLAGPVERGTLAPVLGGVPRDLIGLERTGAWDVVFLGTKFTLERAGRSVSGTAADGESLYIEYDEASGWFSRLEWRDPAGRLLLGYLLVERPDAGISGLNSWKVIDATRASATQGRIATGTARSSGDADLVLLAAVVGPGRAVTTSSSSGGGGSGSLIGGLLDQLLLVTHLSGASASAPQPGVATASVIDPAHTAALEYRSTGSDFQLRTLSDRAGGWQLTASTSGPSVDLVLYRVDAQVH